MLSGELLIPFDIPVVTFKNEPNSSEPSAPQNDRIQSCLISTFLKGGERERGIIALGLCLLNPRGISE